MTTIRKITNFRNQPQMDDLNRLVEEIQALVDNGGGTGGSGAKGDDGFNGYTPVTSLQPRGDDIVVRLDDWVGGTGEAPTQLVGRFLSPLGWVEGIENGMNVRGLQGEAGDKGEAGLDGDNGVGIPMGGATGQVLAKASADSYDTEWIEPPSGGGGGATKFTELTDTPSNLGQNGQVLMSGIDFNTMSPTIEWATLNYPTKITELSDVPNTLGDEGDILVVRFNMNTFQNELTFEPLPTGGGGGEAKSWTNFTPVPVGIPAHHIMSARGVYYLDQNVCHFQIYVSLFDNSDADVVITGLPFAAHSSNQVGVALAACPIQGKGFITDFGGCVLERSSGEIKALSNTGAVTKWIVGEASVSISGSYIIAE